MNAGNRADHHQFCLNEEWQLVSSARGQDVGHHLTYELPLTDGRILRTRISRPPNRTQYGPGLWRTILRDQLLVSEGEFWSCVRDKVRPDRGQPSEVPAKALPAQLVYQLIHDARLPEEQVARMTLDEAIAAMSEFWSSPR